VAAGEVSADGKAVLHELETTLRTLGGILGLFEKPAEAAEIPPEVHGLVADREEARKAKNWAEADRLRDEIQEKGYVLEDKADGTRIKPAKS